MIQRSEVEALLAAATDSEVKHAGMGYTVMVKMPAQIACELIRTWISVQDAPSVVVELEPRSKLRAVAGNTNTMLGQRVRLVPNPPTQTTNEKETP